MIYSGLVTLDIAAIQITDATYGVTNLPSKALARRIFVEPLRGNSAAAYVGLSTVTSDGLGAAIQELAAPQATGALDRFDHTVSGDMRSEDPGVYYVHGASLDVLKVTVWTD